MIESTLRADIAQTHTKNNGGHDVARISVGTVSGGRDVRHQLYAVGFAAIDHRLAEHIASGITS